jgi:glutamate/tyrosine decarboxylase-like PLP-dependent enzyme
MGDRGLTAGGIPFADLGIDLTRNFKALKVWMSLRAHGVRRYARLIEQNVAHVRHLAALVEADPALELLAPVALNVACFRYAPEGVAEARLDALNQEILLRLQERGIATPSGTTVRGRFAIRVANVNHRSRREDFELLARSVVELGQEILDG